MDSKSQTIFLNEKLLNDSAKIIEYLDSNLDYYFNLNGEVVSLYGLMSKFETTKYGNITRYKGLGEMNADELFESTINPADNSQRTLTRYTIEDVKREIDMIKYFNTDKGELIKDMKVTRADVLG